MSKYIIDIVRDLIKNNDIETCTDGNNTYYKIDSGWYKPGPDDILTNLERSTFSNSVGCIAISQGDILRFLYFYNTNNFNQSWSAIRARSVSTCQT